MEKKEIATSNAPAAVGPYSQGIVLNGLVFLSGQLGIDPVSGKMVDGGVEAQAEQIISNIKAVLKEAGSDISKVVKTLVFLKNMADFKKVNTIYASHFCKPYPARSAVAVKELPLNADIEIEVIALP